MIFGTDIYIYLQKLCETKTVYPLILNDKHSTICSTKNSSRNFIINTRVCMFILMRWQQKGFQGIYLKWEAHIINLFWN